MTTGSPTTAAHADVSDARLRRTFVAASSSLVAVFAASSSPIPVFNIYRDADALTTADLSLSVVAYFAGTIVALLCLGRIANHIGRRPAALATLLVMGSLNRPGSGGGSQSMEDESHGSTQEVRRRAA